MSDKTFINTLIKQLILLAGLIIGVLHFIDAVRIIFTLSNNAPLTELVFVFSGFLATLPLVFLGIYTFRYAGILLVICSIVSFIMIIASSYDIKMTLWFTFYNCIITLLIGISMLWMAKREKIRTNNVNLNNTAQ